MKRKTYIFSGLTLLFMGVAENAMCQTIKIGGNIFGGGENGAVGGSTTVTVTNVKMPDYDVTEDMISAPEHSTIFGGGLGATAVVTGSTTVDVALTKECSDLFEVVGGGMNGSVGGTSSVHIGIPLVRSIYNVYGGGYYASVGGSSLSITRGHILNDVYGGGVMGSVKKVYDSEGVLISESGKAITQIGLLSGSSLPFNGSDYTFEDNKNEIQIGGSVYGGNDVSGSIESLAQTTIYGGEIAGNVYGAGNGDHTGYYDPVAVVYKDGENDGNYVSAIGGNIYTSRPETNGVLLTLQGNTAEERLAIHGQVFGGGNSCSIEDDGLLEVTIGSHVTIGQKTSTLQGMASTPYLNEEGENVSGLFMGSSGVRLAQQPASADDQFYHRYHNGSSYVTGFKSGDEAGFDAYVKNILVKSDNVSLTIADDAEDIWLANFVGGGFRGSMQAYSAAGKFSYKLPKGVTVANAVVGGAYDAFIKYKEGGADKYKFEGGVLAENTSDFSGRTHVVHADPRAVGLPDVERDARYMTNYFTEETAGFFTKKTTPLLQLTLHNKLEPQVFENGGDASIHGGIVYGGCFNSGKVQGDSWVDYGCSLSSLCTDERFFNKANMDIYDKLADFDHNNALNVFGAGYGTETHSEGDVYLSIQSVGTETTEMNGDYPFIYNVFGGSNKGTVAGNTNVFYNGGKQGTMLGSLYGGSLMGEIGGNTFVELAGGFLVNVYGGSRQADIDGASHVWAYDGHYNGLSDVNHLIVCNLYGGNDISGTISGTMPAVWTQQTGEWEDLQGKTFNSYVEIAADNASANRGFPLVGSAFAGGNGEKWNPSYGVQPNVGTALIEIDGGTTLRAFGGGNMATITDNTYIFTNASRTDFADVTFADYQKNIMQKVFFSGVPSGYRWEDTRLIMDNNHVMRLFGGNNLATMDIQPTWKLKNGFLANVYSGGNMGDMTYYNPMGTPATQSGGIGQPSGVENNTDGSNANYTPRGLCITIDQPDIHIGSLFGGCRLSDVRPTPKTDQEPWPTGTNGEDFYGATVNILDGYIENVYGGNDISGMVAYGTNVNISGAVSGNVYGSGNGYYLYKWDKDATEIGEYVNENPVNDDNSILYYTVPANNLFGGAGADDTQKILTINAARPSVEKAFLNIAGLAPVAASEGVPGRDKRVAYVKGNVYCGGNASTVNTTDDESGFTKFKIGSYVTLNGVFMGSDGWLFSQDNHLSDFEKINDFDLSSAASNGDGMIPAAEAKYYPNLLSVHMKAVEMKAQPKDFNLNLPLTEAHIGTYCGGGNRGSMLVDKTVTLPFHHDIIIYDKVVAACLDANVTYKNTKAWGGYTRPITDHATYGNTKMDLRIASQFAPMEMDVPDNKLSTTVNSHGETFAAAAAHDFLYPRMNNSTYAASDAYTTGCNIYGGCYQTGEIEGDVILNVYSNMLRYVNEDKLKKAIANNQACFNIYGAGFGQDSHVWGNVKIIVDRSLDTSTMGTIGGSTLSAELQTMLGLEELYTQGSSSVWNIQNQARNDASADNQLNCSYPSFNNVFGGGRNGQLFGNSQLEIRNGRIYSDVVGGSFASNMYGSTQIVVGYPNYYECKVTKEYPLTRGDQWNTTYTDANGNLVLKNKVNYMAGDLVPENVWAEMTTSDQANFTPRKPLPSDEDRKLKSTPRGWDDVHIQIGGGVYGGGYSLANSTAASAGTITTHKLSSTDNVNDRLLNFDGRWYNDGTADGVILSNTAGYGGNSNIMIGDNTGDATHPTAEYLASATKDHIRISTLVAQQVTNTSSGGSRLGKFVREADGRYTHQGDGPYDPSTTYYDLSGEGGIYGDGHLTFCEGFRAADITGYGYAEGTAKYPILLNTFQRLDLLSVNDCCLMLQGAQDFATDAIDASVYSITRINELRMNSTLGKNVKLGELSTSATLATSDASSDGDQFNTIKQRNYLAFFNNVHYLGSLITNDDFTDGYHAADGFKNANSYIAEKSSYINEYHAAPKPKQAGVEAAFKRRNVGTARNAIGINNGYCLRIQNQYYDENKLSQLYYGPIVGVCEVKLLTLVEGEGGGYVYADNIHEEYNGQGAENHFLNTSGNFVFPGIVKSGSLGNQYIVDDCFVQHFGTQDDLTTKDTSHDFQEAHYWFVEGNKYFFNTTLTGYTFKNQLTFNLIENDPNIILSGIKKDNLLNIEKIEWISDHTTDYECVLENNTPNKIDDYEFDIEIGGADTWNTDMPRYSAGKIAETDSPLTSGKTLATNNMPIFNVKLIDKLDNSGNENYYNHLDQPEKVKIYLKGNDGSLDYEYTITLNIKYLKGPTYTGGVTYLNCALPGERIAFSASDIKVETDETMPITGHNWKLLPLIGTNDGNYEWDSNNPVIIPATQYSETLDGSENGWIDALYSQNRWNVAYTFTAGGHDFPVLPVQDLDKNPKEENRMLIVHNYHKMGDVETYHLNPQDGQKMRVVTTSPSSSTTVTLPGARVYIEDETDLMAFINYLNKATAGNAAGIPVGLSGIDFILQNDITLSAALPAISQSFAGTLHGDGYHIDLNGKQNSLFGNNLAGKIYNLGLVNGTSIASSGAVENTYVYTNSDDFTYGKKAYELSHHFAPTSDGYVEKYYANGDYQYARVGATSITEGVPYFDGEHLRTSVPHYGSADTHHLRTHDHDVKRWVSASNVNVPLYSATQHTEYNGAHDAYEDDYLFFGQHLDKENADAYPVHINKDVTGDIVYKGGNRVYKTDGYYHSKNNDGFYYNMDAWALQHKLTAVDYTNRTAEGDGANNFPGKFSLDSNISQNLLVYNEGETIFDKKDVENIAEQDVVYHNIVKNSSGFETDYFHLVDKQCFNAPIAFNVKTRAWYERVPQYFRNVGTNGSDYANPTAWEGICLPFTAKKVTASVNGEITHFYGVDIADPDSDDHTLHHEYWLNGMTAYASGTATFMRPATSGSGLFVGGSQISGSYSYVANPYFTSLEKYIDDQNTRDDVKWYNSDHTFSDYVYLTAGVPYIISFPGNDFYEFSLEGTEYDRASHTKIGDPQKITFDGGATTILVSDDEMKPTTVSGQSHVGTYMEMADADSSNKGVYGMNAQGSSFEADCVALPFRTYMKGSGTAQTRSILIMDPYLADLMEEVTEAPEDELGEDYLKIWSEGRDIVIETSEARNFNLYRHDGTYRGTLHCSAGLNRFSQEVEGIYLVGGEKLLVK